MIEDLYSLCAELAGALERLQKQSVTAPSTQFIELSNGRHPIPLGNDILLQDLMVNDLLDRSRKALDTQPAAPSDEDLIKAAAKALEGHHFPTELVYFLSEDAIEHEPMLLALRAAAATARQAGPHLPPSEAGFDGARGFQMPLDGRPFRVQLKRGSVPPSKFPQANFKEQLLWFMLDDQPPQLLWCNADDQWFELLFTPIEKP